MALCCAVQCRNRSGQFKMKRFPTNPDIQKLWISNIARDGYNFSVNSYVCEVHFAADQWTTKERHRLKKDAIPTIFCRCSSRVPLRPLQNTSASALDHHDYSYSPTRKKLRRPTSSGHEENPSEVRQIPRRKGRPAKDFGIHHHESCPLKVVSSGLDVLCENEPHESCLQSSTDTSRSRSPQARTLLAVSNADEVAAAVALCELSVDMRHRSSQARTPAPNDDCNLERLSKENTRLMQSLNSARRERDDLQTKVAKLQMELDNLSLNTCKRFGTDQLKALSRGGTLRGGHWSDETILKALRLHFAAGPAGYEVASDTQMPLPSIRVLKDRMKHIKFPPGILDEIFTCLPRKTEHMSPLDKESMLSFDEMSIREAREFDSSTKTLIGNCTIAASKPKLKKDEKSLLNNDPVLIEEEQIRMSKMALSTRASKAMIFVLGGVAWRWKQTVAYHFTSSSFSADEVKSTIVEIITKSHEVGIFVRAVVSDMGNRSVWSAFGIDVGPNTNRVWVPHPVDSTKRLYIMPDPVHIFKNVAEMLRSNKEILIDHKFVTEFQLPSNRVKLQHLEILCKYQDNMRWKLAPSLTEDILKVGHFGKMKVSNSSRMFNPRVAAALNFFSILPGGEPGMRTTAWFISIFYRWFTIMTAHTPLYGLGKKNSEAFSNAIGTLSLTVELFQTLQAGHEWKPSQTGVKAATTCILDLAKFYLDELGMDFLLAGRFTSDICENCFSVIRYHLPNPSALQFKQRLKTCVISQFMKSVPKSSYDEDDRTELLDVLLEENKPIPVTSTPRDDEEEVILACLTMDNFHGLKTMPEKDKPVFYRVCGYVVRKMLDEKSFLRECVSCVQACTHNSEDAHQYGTFLRMTNFKRNALLEVSNDVFNVLLTVEEHIMAVEPSLQNLKSDLFSFLEQKVCPSITRAFFVNVTCHDLSKFIVHRYLRMRLKLMSEKPSMSQPSKGSSTQLSSLSMGSRYLASKFVPTRK